MKIADFLPLSVPKEIFVPVAPAVIGSEPKVRKFMVQAVIEIHII